MEHPRFFVGNVAALAAVDIANAFRKAPPPFTAQLPDAAAAHMRVLRLSAGDAVTLFDGLGGEFNATVSDIDKKTGHVDVLAHTSIERESPLQVVVVQALAVGDKMDWIVQKASELGATQIVPVLTERCTLRLSGERAMKRVAHWQQVALAASEQCGRNRVAQLAPISDFARWLASVEPHCGNYFVLHPQGQSATLVDALATLSIRNTAAQRLPLHILIGPEGGLSPAEVRAAEAAGIVAVRLGPRVLRTESAAAAALAVIGAIVGDLR